MVKNTQKPALKIGITGTNTILGRNIAIAAYRKGYEVHSFASQPVNIDTITNHVWDALTNTNSETTELYKSLELDAVIHCDEKSNRFGSQEKFVAVNEQGTQRALQIAPDARFVYISTSAVYALESNRFNLQPTNIKDIEKLTHVHPYAYGKLLGEYIVNNDTRENRTVILRPHLIHNHQEFINFNFVKLVKENKNGKTISLPNKGQTGHSLTHLSEITNVALASAVIPPHHLQPKDNFFNVANEIPIILNSEIPKMLQKFFPKEDIIVNGKSFTHLLRRAQLQEKLYRTKLRKTLPLLTESEIFEIGLDTVLDVSATTKLIQKV